MKTQYYTQAEAKDLFTAPFFGRRFARSIALKCADSINNWITLAAVPQTRYNLREDAVMREIIKLRLVPQFRINSQGLQVRACEK